MEEIRRIEMPMTPPPPVGGGTASQPGRRRREAFRDYLDREERSEHPEPETPSAVPAETPPPAEGEPERGRLVDERA